jgi:hypothetical protein
MVIGFIIYTVIQIFLKKEMSDEYNTHVEMYNVYTISKEENYGIDSIVHLIAVVNNIVIHFHKKVTYENWIYLPQDSSSDGVL